MDDHEVPRDRLGLQENPGLLSPPEIDQLYQCARSVTVRSFVEHATIDIEVAGTVVLSQTVGFPEPAGATLHLPAPLVAGQKVRARQSKGGPPSSWAEAEVRDHLKEFPAGLPRPDIDPDPVFECGVRTGVSGLLGGGDVWITADGAEVGRVRGSAARQQGVNIAPAYGFRQHVRAWAELCGDPSPPSAAEITERPPAPLPAPGAEPVYDTGEQVIFTNIVNGAKVTPMREGVPQGTWGCWGGRFQFDLVPPAFHKENITATQAMCPGDPPSDPGGTTVADCASLPAPSIGPVQGGDTFVTVLASAPGAKIKVFLNGKHVGTNGPPRVWFETGDVAKMGDKIHVVQDLAGCKGQRALEVTVACVDPPFTYDPSRLNLFPVGNADYGDGALVKGSVYYPAEDDGKDQPFRARLAALGPVPIVLLAHGNHSPADPSYQGYDYFQAALARMGIIAASVDCNALNGSDDSLGNIEARADLIIDSIKHFQGLNADPASRFFGRIDFARVGLMGHSRGGDAVVTLPEVISIPGIGIRAVLALAPTNFRFHYGMPTIQPKGYAFMTILPAGDGDVRSNSGAQFYDVAIPGPYKSQLYVHHTSHNLFNRKWAAVDDGVGPPRISQAEHERILVVYGCALFRSRLLGHPTERFLLGYERPYGAPTKHVYLSFSKQELSDTVDTFEEANGIGINSRGFPTSQSAGMSADEFVFAQTAGAFNDTFYGLTRGMVARPGPSGAVFRTETGRMDLTNREIWLRAAEVVDRNGARNPPSATSFRLGLVDARGQTAGIDVEMFGGLPRPYEHPTHTKSMPNTIRFKADCFKALNRELSVKDVDAILIVRNRNDERSLAFDEIQIVTP